MTPIVIATDLGQDDWRELYAYIARRRSNAQPAWLRFGWTVGFAIVTFVALMVIRWAGRKPDPVSLILGVGLTIAGLIVAQRYWIRRGGSSGNKAFFGPVRFELDQHGIRTVRAGMSSAIDWNRVEQIDETPTAIYLALDQSSAFAIPKRSVDPALLPDLVAQLRAWHAERTRTSMSEPAPAFAAAESVTITRDATSTASPKRRGFFRDLLGNLRAGLKVLLLRRVPSSDFTVSFDQLVALLAIVVALLTGLDWLLADADTVFDPYGYYVWAYYLIAGLWAAALIARLQGSQTNTRPLLVTWLAAVPGFIIVLGLVLLLPFAHARLPSVLAAAALVLFVMSDRATRSAFGFAKFGTTLLVVLTVVGVPYVFQTRLELDPHLWVAPESDEGESADTADADNAESLLFDQADRISDAVDSTAPQRPGIVDTYFVGFAGWGTQKVFRNEALFGERIFAKRFGTGRRSVELINDRTDRDTYPLATVAGLRYALQLLGERMDKDEDMLVLLLTSHGSREAGIAVRNGGLPLVDLEPDELRSALDDSGIKWRVVIVSACYAGVFLEPLKSDTTLVITAADADHNSFGCADDRDLTYFGEAFLRDALPGAPTLEAAFAKARALIAAREAEEKLTPSNPQMFVGSEIRKKLAAPASPVDEPPDTAVPGSTITAALRTSE